MIPEFIALDEDLDTFILTCPLAFIHQDLVQEEAPLFENVEHPPAGWPRLVILVIIMTLASRSSLPW